MSKLTRRWKHDSENCTPVQTSLTWFYHGKDQPEAAPSTLLPTQYLDAYCVGLRFAVLPQLELVVLIELFGESAVAAFRENGDFSVELHSSFERVLDPAKTSSQPTQTPFPEGTDISVLPSGIRPCVFLRHSSRYLSRCRLRGRGPPCTRSQGKPSTQQLYLRNRLHGDNRTPKVLTNWPTTARKLDHKILLRILSFDLTSLRCETIHAKR